MGLTLTRLWSVWVARARRRRLRSRSSSQRSVARSHSDDSWSGRGSIADESMFIDASDYLWLKHTREMPILGRGSPVASLPQDLLLR